MTSILIFMAIGAGVLDEARDRQDGAALAAQVSRLSAAAAKAEGDAKAQYELALARSFEAEVFMEKSDKKASAGAAQAGIEAAKKAVAAQGGNAEYHRILGTLCGQVIPANVLAGMKFGRCAMDEVAKAIELNPKAAENWVSRGVGNYYLPAAFGGGIDKAIEDFDKAIQLNGKSAEAYLWRGIALRKAGKNADARTSLAKAIELNPKRVWAKTQLEKTPVK